MLAGFCHALARSWSLFPSSCRRDPVRGRFCGAEWPEDSKVFDVSPKSFEDAGSKRSRFGLRVTASSGGRAQGHPCSRIPEVPARVGQSVVWSLRRPNRV